MEKLSKYLLLMILCSLVVGIAHSQTFRPVLDDTHFIKWTWETTDIQGNEFVFSKFELRVINNDLNKIVDPIKIITENNISIKDLLSGNPTGYYSVQVRVYAKPVGRDDDWIIPSDYSQELSFLYASIRPLTPTKPDAWRP